MIITDHKFQTEKSIPTWTVDPRGAEKKDDGVQHVSQFSISDWLATRSRNGQKFQKPTQALLSIQIVPV